ncbi:MAG TPA: BON domain-containing protein [Magnetospirillaceae bacterium]|jgi:hyperosmotically inducible protein
MTVPRLLLAVSILASLYATSTYALDIGGVLTAPKTLIDRAIEARSTEDIAKDNEIVLKVNAIMAKQTTIKASTEIYEQRLLITGIFNDKPTYDAFERDVHAVPGIKQLYWHVKYMSDDDQKKAHLLDWSTVLVMGEKAQARLVGTPGVADVNFRTAVDSTGTVYLLGRARSQEEATKAFARAKDGDGVKRVVNYVEVRP